jgi:hypothetical protein
VHEANNLVTDVTGKGTIFAGLLGLSEAPAKFIECFLFKAKLDGTIVRESNKIPGASIEPFLLKLVLSYNLTIKALDL